MNKAIQTLEFNKIKERLSEFCQSSLGKQLVDNLYPTVNIKAVETSILSMKSYKDIEEEISYSVRCRCWKPKKWLNNIRY